MSPKQTPQTRRFAALPLIANTLSWPLIFISAIVVSALIAWHLIAQANFAYKALYSALEIDQHIQRFGPTNHYKVGFEKTDTEQHIALFGHIVDAIQHKGHGLSDIRYDYGITTPNGTTEIITEQLLRTPEITHLEDVSRLIDGFYWAGAIGFLLLCVAITLCRKGYLTWPGWMSILGGVVIITGGLGWILYSQGFVRVFYWLHEQIFPDGNEWFFFYQDSLMTTLMKAPDLFAYIAAIWGVVSMIIFPVVIYIIRRFGKRTGY